MLRKVLKLLLVRMLGEGRTDPRGLLASAYHGALIESQRAVLLISRVRLVAALFAFLTPLWVFVDTLFLPAETWPKLAAGRLAATIAFAVLSLLYQRSDRLVHAYVALAALFLIPTLFFAYAHALFTFMPLGDGDIAVSLVTGYAFLPFVIAAGLSIFPLTALEGVLFSLPIFLVQAAANHFGTPFVDDSMQGGLFWLLGLIVAIAVLSGMSQLHYLGEIIVKASHDALTDCFNRATGEELLDKYFSLSLRNGTPLSLLFVDLDHFKSINDRFGHDAGDAVLQQAACNLINAVRREDLVIRWGGEEFVVVMPHGAQGGPQPVLQRLAGRGLGLRPDGVPLTASMGLAERITDASGDTAELVRLADGRMYRAKQSGRNRLCLSDEEGAEATIAPFLDARPEREELAGSRS